MMIKRAVRIAGPAGLTAMLLALSACGSIGNPLEALGAKIPPPDEFQVIARKPLMMPATATLPEPRPGASSPLDPDPHRDALQALFGTSGSPVVSTIEPGAAEGRAKRTRGARRRWPGVQASSSAVRWEMPGTGCNTGRWWTS